MAAGRTRTRAFHAPSDFELPDLGEHEFVTSAAERSTAVHFDTDDLRLTRRGIDVRYVHATTGPGTWVLHAPRKLTTVPAATPSRSREFVGGPTNPPGDLVAAVRCCLGPKKLGPVARTRTDRRSTTVVDGAVLVATVHHDQLSLLEGRRVAVRADELQLEPGPRTAGDAVDEIERRLRAGGADDLRAPSTLAAMLGTRASTAPAPTVPVLTRRSTFAEAVQVALAENVHGLLHHLPLVHLGGHVTGVHQARVAVRRYRSHLRTFSPLLDDERRTDVDARLAQLGGAMGPVRELDVLVESLTTAAGRVAERDRPGALALVDWFDRQRPPALAELLGVLGGAAAAGAATAAVTFASAPPIVDRGHEPARLVLTDLARRSWRRAARLANQLDAHSPTEQLHELRILVKRARYAALAATPVRSEAAPHARALARLQDALGEINDISITEERVLAAVASGLGAEAAYAAGLIVAAERHRSERRRAAWPQLWDEARRKKVRGWLDERGVIVQAAGGVLWRQRKQFEVLVIHRPAYGDWTFPKGKRDRRDVDMAATAKREVLEETGYVAALGQELIAIEYVDRKGRYKHAAYWEMRPETGAFRPNHEVDEIRWIAVARVHEILTYDRDRQVLAAFHRWLAGLAATDVA